MYCTLAKRDPTQRCSDKRRFPNNTTLSTFLLTFLVVYYLAVSPALYIYTVHGMSILLTPAKTRSRNKTFILLDGVHRAAATQIAAVATSRPRMTTTRRTRKATSSFQTQPSCLVLMVLARRLIIWTDVAYVDVAYMEVAYMGGRHLYRRFLISLIFKISM